MRISLLFKCAYLVPRAPLTDTLDTCRFCARSKLNLDRLSVVTAVMTALPARRLLKTLYVSSSSYRDTRTRGCR